MFWVVRSSTARGCDRNSRYLYVGLQTPAEYAGAVCRSGASLQPLPEACSRVLRDEIGRQVVRHSHLHAIRALEPASTTEGTVEGSRRTISVKVPPSEQRQLHPQREGEAMTLCIWNSN